MKKIAFDVPRKMFQVAQQPGAKDTPYDLCLQCPFMNETCDGPNVLAMSNERWVEWANRRANQMDLTRADIAEQSGIPLSTINTVMSGRTKDARHSTIRDITRVLIGGCWGQYPCHFAALLLNGDQLEEESDQALELKHLREQVALLKEEKQEAAEDNRRKVEFLKERLEKRDLQIDHQEALLQERMSLIKKRDWIIITLVVIVLALLLTIIAALVIDRTNPDIGFFWREVVENMSQRTSLKL